MSSTGTTAGARDHARQQAGTAVRAMPTLPASTAAHLPAGVDPAAMLWEETLDHGEYGAHHLPRGAVLRLTDCDGDACAHVIVHNAAQPSERLNLADTVKIQWQAYPTTGALLLSDMGRALMAIEGDTSTRHDTLCGAPIAEARPQFVLAAAKAGLERRDVPPSISFFKGVRVDTAGRLILDPAPAAANTYVELRALLDVHVAVVNAPHVLDDRVGAAATPLRLTAWRAAADASPAAATPEQARALLNNDDWLAARA
jgi:uncharacterized protein YcgI (DUF1989 family)